MSISVIDILSEVDAVNALRTVSDAVDRWCINDETRVQPTEIDFLNLSINLKNIRQSLAFMPMQINSSRWKIAEMDNKYQTFMMDVTGQIMELQTIIDEQKKELNLHRGDAAAIEAASILRAAETRFLDMICLNSAERSHYGIISDLLTAISLNRASPAVVEAWQKYSSFWDLVDMPRISRELSEARGGIVHREDRCPEKYQNMTPTAVNKALRAVKLYHGSLTHNLIARVVDLHKLTMVKLPIDAEDEDEASEQDAGR